MNELIPINMNDPERITVSARDLHSFLEVGADFRHWFPRMCEYGFEEGKDFRTFLTESSGGRPGQDAQITIDMAKELSAICPADALCYAAEGTELALAAVKITRMYIVSMASKSPDETYRYVTRRENELTLEACSAAAAEVTAKAEESLQTVHD